MAIYKVIRGRKGDLIAINDEGIAFIDKRELPKVKEGEKWRFEKIREIKTKRGTTIPLLKPVKRIAYELIGRNKENLTVRLYDYGAGREVEVPVEELLQEGVVKIAEVDFCYGGPEFKLSLSPVRDDVIGRVEFFSVPLKKLIEHGIVEEVVKERIGEDYNGRVKISFTVRFINGVEKTIKREGFSKELLTKVVRDIERIKKSKAFKEFLEWYRSLREEWDKLYSRKVKIGVDFGVLKRKIEEVKKMIETPEIEGGGPGKDPFSRYKGECFIAKLEGDEVRFYRRELKIKARLIPAPQKSISYKLIPLGSSLPSSSIFGGRTVEEIKSLLLEKRKEAEEELKRLENDPLYKEGFRIKKRLKEIEEELHKRDYRTIFSLMERPLRFASWRSLVYAYNKGREPKPVRELLPLLKETGVETPQGFFILTAISGFRLEGDEKAVPWEEENSWVGVDAYEKAARGLANIYGEAFNELKEELSKEAEEEKEEDYGLEP